MYRRTRRCQWGSAALQIALVMPVVLLLITATVQIATLQTDRNVLQSAAVRGVEIARVQGGTSEGGTAAVRQALVQFHGLHDVRVGVVRVAGTVRVDVTATAPSVLPGLEIPLHASASGPQEPAA